MPQIPRRRFLYSLAGGASLVALGSLPQLRPARRRTGPLVRVTRTSWALGSTVKMTALHQDESIAAAAIEAAFAELELVEQVMSIYRPESQLSRLNRLRVLDNPHPYLVKILEAAAAMSQRTHGAFDVTVQPLWQSYWQGKTSGVPPTVEELAAAKRKIDWRSVSVTAKRVHFQQTDTAITLNGIAQGFAADRATAALRRHGITEALIDTGEFGTLGLGSDGDGWNVGIQHPRREDAFVAVANLAGRCLATSGDYATTFDDTFTSHHLLDPVTGRPASELASVSIVAKTGLEADALSTATFVLGFEAGRELVAATPHADVLLMTKTGRTWSSPGFPTST